jgi:hypothetical protein
LKVWATARALAKSALPLILPAGIFCPQAAASGAKDALVKDFANRQGLGAKPAGQKL